MNPENRVLIEEHLGRAQDYVIRTAACESMTDEAAALAMRAICELHTIRELLKDATEDGS